MSWRSAAISSRASCSSADTGVLPAVASGGAASRKTISTWPCSAAGDFKAVSVTFTALPPSSASRLRPCSSTGPRPSAACRRAADSALRRPSRAIACTFQLARPAAGSR